MSSKVNLSIYRGDTYLHQFVWQDSEGTPINLTGYSARMHIRDTVDSDTIVVELTDSDGITLGGAFGTIDLSISSANTTLLTGSKYVYDLELTDAAGVVTTLVYGDIKMTAEVTR